MSPNEERFAEVVDFAAAHGFGRDDVMRIALEGDRWWQPYRCTPTWAARLKAEVRRLAGEREQTHRGENR